MKRNEFIQFKGRIRSQHFQPQKPSQAPQNPSMTMRTNSRNQYRGHGRGQ